MIVKNNSRVRKGKTKNALPKKKKKKTKEVPFLKV